MFTRSKGKVEKSSSALPVAEIERREDPSTSLPQEVEISRVVRSDDVHFQPAMSSFGAAGYSSPQRSRSSMRSGSVAASRLAAEARHAAALLQIAEEERMKEKQLAQLKIDAQNRALAAELAAIESSSSRHLTSVHSWVRSLPKNMDAPPVPSTSRPNLPIPEAVGPMVAQDIPEAAPAVTRFASTDIDDACTRPEVPQGYEQQISVPPGFHHDINPHSSPHNIEQTSPSHCNDIQQLAQAIASLGHKPRVHELPLFSGKATDWIAFKQAYTNTCSSFSSVENVARIRSALRGEATLAVSALALTCTDPEELIRALEDRFARPEFVILEELAAVRSLPRLQSDYKDLNLISCKIQNLVAIIKHLNSLEYLYSPELYHSILSKLTPLLRSLWIRYAAEHSSGSTKLEMLSDFLRQEARSHIQFGLLPQIHSEHPRQQRRVDFCNTTRVIHDSGVCGCCKGNHFLADCSKFKSLSADSRMQLVLNSKRCFRCLGNKRHNWRSCHSKKCDIDGCQSFHHRLLHGVSVSQQGVSVKSEIVSDRTKEVCTQTYFKNSLPSSPVLDSSYTCSHEQFQHQKVLLKVLPVIISGPLGEIETFALLDDGSTATLIDSEVASQIGLSGPEGNIRVQGVGGMVREDKIRYVDLKIRGKYSNVEYPIHNARAIRNLNLTEQVVRLSDILKYSHLSDIAHEVCFDEGKPTILIGAADWYLTVAREVKAGSPNQPVATLTLLGWAVHGASNSKTKKVDFINHTETLEDFDFLVQQNLADRGDICDKNDGSRNKEFRMSSMVFGAVSSPEDWPSEVSSSLSNECLQEFKTSVTTHTIPESIHVIVDESRSPRFLPVTITAEPMRFSSWLRMVRATARAHQYVQILINRVRSKSHLHQSSIIHQSKSSTVVTASFKSLEPEDLVKAEMEIFRRSQRESFSEDFYLLLKDKPIEKRSRLWRLSPYLDSEGVIRIRGRIGSADVPEESKWPIVLDGRHPAIRLFLKSYHQKAGHANPNFVINEVRQRFWILGLRNAIRSIAQRCAWCTLNKAKSLSPPIGDLPPERLAHHRRPFTYVGLDYMGPMLITIGRRHEKRYIALFTCFTCRAIHLEVVASLSADSALMALKRFIARRGTPTTIFSDNGTAFVGANNILKAMAEAGANSGISWSFQPPAAPHMSGVWERLVRSVKVALRAMLKDRTPKEELFHTTLLEVEALVNSRPLTDVPADPGSEEALTPFHFLLGSSSPYHPVPKDLDNGDLLSRSDWRKSQRLADMFWSRWVREYLPMLLPRGSSAKGQRSVAVGDVVLIVDPSLPRGTWPRGRVCRVFQGRDGVVRVADVSTAGGTLRRPLTKLVQLTIPSH